MFGYMSAKNALKSGFTHHGKYYGIPVWVGGFDSEAPIVAAKWSPMEYAMTAAHYIEGFINSVFYPDREPMFQFLIGKEIVVTPDKRG